MIRFETQEQKDLTLKLAVSVPVQTTVGDLEGEATADLRALLAALRAAEVGPCPACPVQGSD